MKVFTKSHLKFMFSKKATKIEKVFTVDLTVKIWSIFVAFLEKMNFTKISSDILRRSQNFGQSYSYNLTLVSKIKKVEDWSNFCGLLRISELLFENYGQIYFPWEQKQ